ncbi:MAG: PAS domain S-box protein [Pseudomonadota bacterium]
MNDKRKTKEQLIQELEDLHQRIAELEKSETERRQTEEKLRDREESYRNLFENANEAIFVAQEGKLVFLNPKTTMITGYSGEELVSRPFIEFIHPDDRDIVSNRHVRRMKGEEITQLYDFRIIHRDGIVRSVELNVVAINWKGRPATLNFLSDITDRKQAEEALRESEEKYKALIETTDTGYLIVDSEGNVVDANSEYVRLSGQATLKEIVGRSVFDWTAGHDLARNRAEVIKCLERGFVRGLEIDYIDPEGRITPVEIHATVIRKGDSLQIVSLCRDISGRKQTEYALRLSEEKLSKAFQASPDWISISTLDDGWYLDVNETYLRVTGFTRKEVVGHTSMEINLWNNPDDRKKGLEIIRENGALKDFEVEFKLKSGEIKLMLWSAELIELEGKKFILSVCQDITDRKQAEERLRESERKYRELVENANSIILRWSRDGKITFMNEFGQQFFGFTEAEILGRHVIGSIVPETESTGRELGPLMDRICANPKDFEQNINENMRRNGERVWISWTNKTVLDKQGQVLEVLSIGSDITERMQAEKELQISLEKLRKAMGGIIQAMSSTIEIRDSYTAGHQRRVADLARAIAQEMGLPEDPVDGLRMAGIVHDLGKISIPAEILTKPTKLSDLEFGLIKTHPQISYDILKDIDFPWPVAEIVLQHHERINGTGYPQGLKGENIFLEARILAVADVVEAIASHRPYRPALGIDKAFEEIEKNKGILYDAEVVDACLRLFKEKGFKLSS